MGVGHSVVSRLLGALFAGVLAVLLVLGAFVLGPVSSAHAAEVQDTIGDMTFVADDANVAAGATVTGFSGPTQSNVTIPASVTLGGTVYQVTSIGAYAFSNDALSGVVIPDGVTSIGDYAFESNQLSEVVIPGSVTSIGTGAFTNNQLSRVVIPGSVTSIGIGAFFDNALSVVVIPGSVTWIGAGAFAYNYLSSVVIPASVTTIGVGAFAENPDLGSVYFEGNPPTAFEPATATNPSLGSPADVVVYFVRDTPGFVVPVWQGYQSRVWVDEVTFDAGAGVVPSVVSADHGLVLPRPVDPVREGFVFTGWFTDSGATVLYDFDSVVSGPFTLFAGWSAVSPEPTPTPTPNPAPEVTPLPGQVDHVPGGVQLAKTGVVESGLVSVFGVLALVFGSVLLVRRSRS